MVSSGFYNVRLSEGSFAENGYPIVRSIYSNDGFKSGNIGSDTTFILTVIGDDVTIDELSLKTKFVKKIVMSFSDSVVFELSVSGDIQKFSETKFIFNMDLVENIDRVTITLYQDINVKGVQEITDLRSKACFKTKGLYCLIDSTFLFIKIDYTF